VVPCSNENASHALIYSLTKADVTLFDSNAPLVKGNGWCGSTSTQTPCSRRAKTEHGELRGEIAALRGNS